MRFATGVVGELFILPVAVISCPLTEQGTFLETAHSGSRHQLINDYRSNACFLYNNFNETIQKKLKVIYRTIAKLGYNHFNINILVGAALNTAPLKATSEGQ